MTAAKRMKALIPRAANTVTATIKMNIHQVPLEDIHLPYDLPNIKAASPLRP
jgi:hypothetical protein